jgi:hypothetical protein
MQAHLFGRPEVTRIILLEPTGVLVGLAPYRALRTELHARGFTADGGADVGADAPGTTRTPGEAPDPVVAADASEHLTNLGQNLAPLDDGTATTAAAAAAAATAAAVTEAAAAAAEAAAASRETDAAAFSAASGVRTLRISLARFEGRTLDRRLVETLCAVRAAECL